MELLSDNSIDKEDEDTFGFMPYVDILYESIIDTKSLPFTVGIFGKWGTGKTSLMNLLRNRFENNEIKTVWFNPWKYDSKEALWTALIQSILLEIHKDKNISKELKNKTWDLIKNIAWFAVKEGISKATGGIVSADKVESMKSKYAVVNKTEHNFLNEFEGDFSKLIEEYVGKGERLIIFIDDLDRCIPENAIAVLESLKLYLDHSQCVFILGMDRTVVELGIKHRYGEEIKLSGREYLEKIVQLPFFLPPIQFDRLKDTLISKPKAVDYPDKIWDLIRYGLRGNPRKAKRFVNSFYLVRSFLNHNEVLKQITNNFSPDELKEFNSIKKDDKLFLLAKILIIKTIFPDFYDLLILNPDFWGIYIDAVKIMDKPDKLQQHYKKYPEIKQFSENNSLREFMAIYWELEIPGRVLEHLLGFTGIMEGGYLESEEKLL